MGTSVDVFSPAKTPDRRRDVRQASDHPFPGRVSYSTAAAVSPLEAVAAGVPPDARLSRRNAVDAPRARKGQLRAKRPQSFAAARRQLRRDALVP